MARELAPIDIRHAPELAALADEVHATRTPRRLVRDDEDVAVLVPAPVRTSRHRRRVLRADDPLFDLVGIGRSDGPGDVSANKHRYLVEAVRAAASPDPTP